MWMYLSTSRICLALTFGCSGNDRIIEPNFCYSKDKTMFYEESVIGSVEFHLYQTENKTKHNTGVIIRTITLKTESG